MNIAETAELRSLNADVFTTLQGEHFADEIANLTSEQFYQVDAAGNLVANTGFGTVTQSAGHPQTVTYEIAKGRKWSDGQPVDSADLLLSYAAATDPEDIRFTSRRSGNGLQYAAVTDVGLRSITLKFSQAVSDWKTALRVTVPAHIVAAQALNGIEATAGKAAVIEAVQGKDSSKLEKLANAYRDTYWVGDGSLPDGAFVSDGAYAITKVVPQASVELTANKKYQGSYPPIAENVTIRLFSDSMAALSDMNAGNTDIIAATESGLVTYADLVNALPSITSVSADSVLKKGATADTITFNFRPGSLFASASLRKAFLHVVPKAKIVQSASNSTTVTAADSFVFPDTSDFYSSAVSQNGSLDYLMQDVEQSSEIIKRLKLKTPIDVRVIFDKLNPRSTAEFKALSERAASAGFNLIDASSDSPSRAMLAGEFDVLIAPRAIVGISGSDPQSLIADPVTKFQDESVAKLLVNYASATKDIKRADILEQIDTQLYKSFYGLPLYQVPNLIIFNKALGAISTAPYGDSATWGYWTWSVSTK